MTKTREQIITDMCYTWRHDYGIERDSDAALDTGMTKDERAFLWQQMAQIYDNCIAPAMQPRAPSAPMRETNNQDRWEKYNWTTWTEP